MREYFHHRVSNILQDFILILFRFFYRFIHLCIEKYPHLCQALRGLTKVHKIDATRRNIILVSRIVRDPMTMTGR